MFGHILAKNLDCNTCQPIMIWALYHQASKLSTCTIMRAVAFPLLHLKYMNDKLNVWKVYYERGTFYPTDTLCFWAPVNTKWLHIRKFEAAQHILETKATWLTVSGRQGIGNFD